MEAIHADNFSILNITSSHPFALRNLPNIHKDPFDRILIAQTLVEKMTLLTADHTIKKYDVLTL
jgi:PIN domain nuclease of toxin-antitoxin system